MAEITITRTINAEQWVEGAPLPKGCFECRPEICWSGNRSLVYFEYAELRPTAWIGAVKETVPDEEQKQKLKDSLEGLMVYTPKEGEPYARKYLPFYCWSVKSEASIKRDWRPVFLDPRDADTLALWHDYCSAEQWPNPIPRRIEYRDIDGKYGRGYRPIYMKPGDWLLRENVPDGHDNLGTKEVITVVSDDEFQRMRAQAPPGATP